MHSILQLLALTILFFAAQSLSSPLVWDFNSNPFSTPTEPLGPPNRVRARSPENTNVNPNAVTGTVCNNPAVSLNTHDTNVALLSICGGIAGTIEFCGGNPVTTIGSSGTSKFTLTAVNAANGATINVSKGRWEGCVRAAQATCPTGTFTSTCVGGTSDGAGFTFVLSEN